MEYQQSDSYLRDVKTGIRQEEQSLQSFYDAFVSACTARAEHGKPLTAEDAYLLARSTASFSLDRGEDVLAALEAYAADTELTRKHEPPTSWSELEEQLEYTTLISDNERREAVAQRTVKRGLQHLLPD